jgi:mRNA-degrading endonuclease RelE of RelBE toxin-antitoxin system
MYNYIISDNLLKILRKIGKKDKGLYEKILKKIDEIIKTEDIDRYKNLRYDLKDSKRVHIGHYVLIFQYDKKSNSIIFENFDHHDKVYKNREVKL